ncbi:MAG: thioredoxin-dependent thiol peroxidase [Armatimonadetes bacterium]|nr:thioredoxin-dependent thiol peroxidase [Armatimonadota bacterium]MDE2206045.1 thioredoxin-dependent thiol peroxidase [Armatimonadota bacterium]
MLQPGDPAPEFSLSDQDGRPFSLADARGKVLVLYFYPKADTPGCTTEACSFGESMPRFDASNALIVGVSPDTVKAQKKFAEKFSLRFRLLADADHTVSELYGVWAEKRMYGRTYMGVERTTFVIAADGTIARIFPKVSVTGHAEAVLAAVNEVA